MWFKVHRNVNDIRKQIIAFIKKHIIILFTHKSIHNSDRKGIKYRMSSPRWSTSLVVNKQFLSDQSAVDQNETSYLTILPVMLTCLSRILVFCWCNHLWRIGQLFFVHFLMSVSGFRWWDHKPLLRIPWLVVGSWGSWFLLLVSFWSTADWSDQNCLFTTREVDQRG
jgi:hypothetical protein